MSDAARPARARASSVSREGSGRFRREKRFFFRCRDSGPTAAPRHGRMAFSSPLGTKARVEAPRARRGTHLPVLVVRPVLLRRSDPAHVRRGRGRGAHSATPFAPRARPVGQTNVGFSQRQRGMGRGAEGSAGGRVPRRRAFARAPRAVASAPRAERFPGTRAEPAGGGGCLGIATPPALLSFAFPRHRGEKSTTDPAAQPG